MADVAAGNRMTCVRLTGGDVRCFGDAELGQLGYGNRIDIGVGQNNTPAAQPPVDVGGAVAELYLATGAHICARVSTGQVRCWGSGFEGRLGYGNTNNVGDATTPASHPALVLPGVPLTLHAGGAHTCALFGPNDVRCWGRNQEGQLGLGDTEIRGDSIAEQPASLPSVSTGGPVVQVASGGFFSCARFADLTIACWGDNTKGQLGFGDMLPRGHSGATVPSLNGRSSVF